MASHPPQPCCYSGVQCEGEPKYNDRKIGEDVAYVASAFGDHIKPNKAIIYFSDVGGIWHNSRLLADQFAAAGYLTVVPNCHGKVRKTGGTLADTVITQVDAAKCVKAALDYLRNECKVTHIGAVGYCAGAPYVVNALASRTVEAGYIAHPAGVGQNSLQRIRCPLSIASADEDAVFQQSMRIASEDILKNSGYPYQINLYSHVQHGFAVRRSVSTKAEVYAKKQAFIQAITWFEEHLLNGE